MYFVLSYLLSNPKISVSKEFSHHSGLWQTQRANGAKSLATNPFPGKMQSTGSLKSYTV